MKVLILGGGGREHALAWKAAQSDQVEIVFVAPGNAGTALEPKVENVNIQSDDIDALCEFALSQAIDLTIVGPEGPLVAGIVDHFNEHGLRCFGPTREAAQLEGSKVWMKTFLRIHGIPSASYGIFDQLHEAVEYIRKLGAPIVVKTDGLAAGKGVTVAFTEDDAIAAATGMLSGELFGDVGKRIVIEEFLEGEEASFIAMVDGEHILPLATSQDHKTVFDGNTGPNTGGMGAYSPAPVITDTVYQRIMDEIMVPTVRGFAAEGHPFKGFLYAGLMIAPDGTPKALEFNVRFGDPETQPIMMRLQSDLVELCQAGVDGTLDEHLNTVRWDPRPCVGVVLAAGGYPGSYRKDHYIHGLKRELVDTKVFHAGTTSRNNGDVFTNGGRVLCVCGLGDTVADAQAIAYQRVQPIKWDGMHYRRDIGFKAIE